VSRLPMQHTRPTVSATRRAKAGRMWLDHRSRSDDRWAVIHGVVDRGPTISWGENRIRMRASGRAKIRPTDQCRSQARQAPH